MFVLRGEDQRPCHFYNYDPIAKICWLNHLEPGTPSYALVLAADPGNWETWIPVEPSYNNRRYKNQVGRFAERFDRKIVFFPNWNL